MVVDVGRLDALIERQHCARGSTGRATHTASVADAQYGLADCGLRGVAKLGHR